MNSEFLRYDILLHRALINQICWELILNFSIWNNIVTLLHKVSSLFWQILFLRVNRNLLIQIDDISRLIHLLRVGTIQTLAFKTPVIKNIGFSFLCWNGLGHLAWQASFSAVSTGLFRSLELFARLESSLIFIFVDKKRVRTQLVMSLTIEVLLRALAKRTSETRHSDSRESHSVPVFRGQLTDKWRLFVGGLFYSALLP